MQNTSLQDLVGVGGSDQEKGCAPSHTKGPSCLEAALGLSCGFHRRGHVGIWTWCAHGNVLSASVPPSHEPAVGTDAFVPQDGGLKDQRTEEVKPRGGKMGWRQEMEQSRGVAHSLRASMAPRVWVCAFQLMETGPGQDLALLKGSRAGTECVCKPKWLVDLCWLAESGFC